MRLLALPLIALFTATAAHAQDLKGLTLEGIKPILEDGRTATGSSESCVKSLEAITVIGASYASTSPFSSVYAGDIEGDLMSRLKLVIDGEKHHVLFRCDESELVHVTLRWDEADDLPKYEYSSANPLSKALLSGIFRSSQREPIDGGLNPSRPAMNEAPLSQGERARLAISVQQCWVVDVGSPEAETTVTVSFRMNLDGTVNAESIQLMSHDASDEEIAERAFLSARRAILRCQRAGYPLPEGKYEDWKEMELTFDPTQMRLQ